MNTILQLISLILVLLGTIPYGGAVRRQRRSPSFTVVMENDTEEFDEQSQPGYQQPPPPPSIHYELDIDGDQVEDILSHFWESTGFW